MRFAQRLERLEARAPKPKRRTILVWVDAEGRRTKAADSDPDLLDPNTYNACLAPYRAEELNPDADPQTERCTPPTLERLLERVERDAWRGLSREEQKLVAAADPPSSVMERYRCMVSAALTNVDDEALDRMILFYQLNTSRAEFRP